MNSTVTPRNTYTAAELADLRLPGFPTSRKNWYPLLKRLGWQMVERPGKGPGGLRREFKPPPEVQAVIDAQQGEGVAYQRAADVVGVASGFGVESSPSPDYRVFGRLRPGVDVELLPRCAAACAEVWGLDYQQAPVADQVKAAARLYNLLAVMPGGLKAVRQLDAVGLAAQLRLFVQMEAIDPWPPRET